MEEECVVAAEDGLGPLGAAEPPEGVGGRGFTIVDLKKLAWTVDRRFQLEKGESDTQHLPLLDSDNPEAVDIVNVTDFRTLVAEASIDG